MSSDTRSSNYRYNRTNVLANDEESDSFSPSFQSMNSEISESDLDFNVEGRNTLGITWPAYGLDDSNDEFDHLKDSVNKIDFEELDGDVEKYDLELPVDLNSLFEIDSNYGMSSESESDDEDDSDDDAIDENEVMKFAKDPDDPEGRNVRRIIKCKIGKVFERLEIPQTIKEEEEEAEFHHFLTEMQRELGLFELNT